MDCPHCGIENLVGAAVCAACGKSMLSRPKFLEPEGEPAQQVSRPSRGGTMQSAPGEMADPPPLWGGGGAAAHDVAPPAQAALAQAMCRICQSPFDVAEGAKGPHICPSCRTISADIDRMGPNDVQIHPSTVPNEDFAGRLGSANLRPKPIAVKKAGLRTGPVAAVTGLVLALVGFAVVSMTGGEVDRTKEILGDVRLESSTVEMAPADGFVARHESRLRLDVARDEARTFGGNTSRVLEVQQTTRQTSEAAFLREDEKGLLFDVSAHGQVVDQLGHVGPEDARDAALYSWAGPHAVIRVRAPAHAPLEQLDGAAVTPGNEVPPFFHVGALRPAALTFKVGDRWKAELVFPALVDRQGRLLTWSFPADVSYAGRAVKNGYACAAFRVAAQVPKSLPKSLDDAFNRRSGKIVGAVWVDLTTGIVAGADLDIDVRFWKEAGRVDDDMRIRGRLTVDRK